MWMDTALQERDIGVIDRASNTLRHNGLCERKSSQQQKKDQAGSGTSNRIRGHINSRRIGERLLACGCSEHRISPKPTYSNPRRTLRGQSSWKGMKPSYPKIVSRWRGQHQNLSTKGHEFAEEKRVKHI
jgi:hypothetical protein